MLGRATVRRLEVSDSVRLVEADLQHLARLGEEEKLREKAKNLEQAIDRAGAKVGDKGYECATGAIELVNLLRQI